MYPYQTGEPWLSIKDNSICYNCYIELIPKIYEMAGCGDGGIIHLIFKSLLTSSHNRKRRISLSAHKSLLEKLLSKYNFKCVYCGKTRNLTIDHIRPVSRGGSDKFSNLQILCKQCNSKKGTKWDSTS